ncbi:MAG: hypothetical protein ACI30I_04270 [Parabacteroides sp.]
MTKEEAIKELANTKVYVNGKSIEIQEKLFLLGFQWANIGKQVLYKNKPFLFLWEDMEICQSDDMEYFAKNAFREITVTDILNIVIDEPKYRPFKDAEECWQEMLKHQPFGWVLNGGVFFQVLALYGNAFYTQDQEEIYFDDALKTFTFADGTPFGIKTQ